MVGAHSVGRDEADAVCWLQVGNHPWHPHAATRLTNVTGRVAGYRVLLEGGARKAELRLEARRTGDAGALNSAIFRAGFNDVLFRTGGQQSRVTKEGEVCPDVFNHLIVGNNLIGNPLKLTAAVGAKGIGIVKDLNTWNKLHGVNHSLLIQGGELLRHVKVQFLLAMELFDFRGCNPQTHVAFICRQADIAKAPRGLHLIGIDDDNFF